jgi:ABC-2 type transport system ATP-binding protein
MIKIVNVSKKFGDIAALDSVSFQVSAGKITGFLGANGAGKTTMLEIMSGCMVPDAGDVTIEGVSLSDRPDEVKSIIGYLPDTPPLYADMSVIDFIRYAAALRKVPFRKIPSLVDKVVSKLQLTSVENRTIRGLSKGYRQRVGLAGALVHDPKLLILDEPMDGLDPGQIVLFRELLNELRGYHSIFLSSHILKELECLCDEIIIIDKGKVIKQFPIHELACHLKVQLEYLLKIERSDANLAWRIRQIDEDIEFHIVENMSPVEIRLKVSALWQLDRVVEEISHGKYGLRGLFSSGSSLENVYFQSLHS